MNLRTASLSGMKNEHERVKLLRDRVLAELNATQFRHKLLHHTDIPISRINRYGTSLWVTLEDESSYIITVNIMPRQKRGVAK